MEARTYTSTLEEPAIIERVVRIVSTVRGTKPNYAHLAAELEQFIPFDVFGVVLLRHDRQAVRVTVCHRETNTWVASYQQHPCEGSKFAQMLQTPALMLAEYPHGLDGPPATSGDALSNHHHLYSTLIVPLLVEDRVLGSLELGSMTPKMYSDTRLQRLVSAVAGVLASAIEGVQQGGSAAIQDRQRKALKDVSSALTSKMDLSTILDQIVAGIANALNVASFIVMQDRRKRILRLEAQSGLDQAILERVLNHNVLNSEQSIIGLTLSRRQHYLSQDIATDERFPESKIFSTELGIHSILSYPLVTGTTVYGALLLCSPEEGGFTPLKADILSLFASQATVAIHNGVLLESAHQRSRFQAAIERLERLQAQNKVSLQEQEREEYQALEQSDLQEEAELLASIRRETRNTFGVSFTSLLRFISNHLLTQGEKDLQALLFANQSEHMLGNGRIAPLPISSSGEQEEEKANEVMRLFLYEQQPPLENTLSLLTRMAEVALVRTDMVGELSRLLIQLKQETGGMAGSWFVMDLHGNCIYMNEAAESLCEMRSENIVTIYGTHFFPHPERQGPATPIETVFARLLPRMRNAEEVQIYLEEFEQISLHQQEIRCVLSMETISEQAQSSSLGAESHALTQNAAPSDRHYRLMRHPLVNQQGALVATALQVTDVTEQVRDEKNRSALLASVSHDLRTPLTTIKAAVTGLLQDDIIWSEQDRQAMLEDINSEADHLTVLVNALVELSRIEMGALVLEKEWCDVIEVIYGMLPKVERILTGRHLHLNFPSHLPLIYVDHVQLARVFTNLIENAVHRSPGQEDIFMKLGVIGDILRVEVMDRGGDIPEIERERIFRSFYSLRSYGNGLGLSICKGIVEAHRGNIWVERGEEGGASFVFTLPTHSYTRRHVEGKGPSVVSWSPSNAGTTSSQQAHQLAGEEQL